MQSDEPRHVDIPVYDVHLPYSEEYVYDVPDIARAPGSKHAELYTPSGITYLHRDHFKA